MTQHRRNSSLPDFDSIYRTVRTVKDSPVTQEFLEDFFGVKPRAAAKSKPTEPAPGTVTDVRQLRVGDRVVAAGETAQVIITSGVTGIRTDSGSILTHEMTRNLVAAGLVQKASAVSNNQRRLAALLHQINPKGELTDGELAERLIANGVAFKSSV